MAVPAATGPGLSTLLLVHGAWHGPWCWELLLPHLQSPGFTVQCAALPSLTSPTPVGLAEDARHLSAVLKQIEGPVVLCGHSYGGMVISAADTAQADVRRLVYLCAYMTGAGESMESALRAAGERRPGHWVRRLPEGRTQVDPRRARELFYHDCQSAIQDWALERLQSQWGQGLAEPVAAPAWQRVPSTYVVCAQDRVLAASIQRGIFGARAQQVVTLHSGHSPFLAQPLQLAQVLLCVAQ